MEFSVNIVDRIYNNLMEHCTSYNKDINEYICECIENRLYVDMYGDLNNRFKLHERGNISTETTVVKLQNIDASDEENSKITGADDSLHKVEDNNVNIEKTTSKRTRRILKSK